VLRCAAPPLAARTAVGRGARPANALESPAWARSRRLRSGASSAAKVVRLRRPARVGAARVGDIGARILSPVLRFGMGSDSKCYAIPSEVWAGIEAGLGNARGAEGACGARVVMCGSTLSRSGYTRQNISDSRGILACKARRRGVLHAAALCPYARGAPHPSTSRQGHFRTVCPASADLPGLSAPFREWRWRQLTAAGRSARS